MTHMAPLLQILCAGTVVMACAAYWLGRMFPALGSRSWQAAGTVLRGLHAPGRMVRYATRRANRGTRNGCGGCSGCAGRNKGPRPHD